jgi:hypothetical protein
LSETGRKTARKMIADYVDALVELGGVWEHRAWLTISLDTDAAKQGGASVGGKVVAPAGIVGGEVSGGWQRQLQVSSDSGVVMGIESWTTGASEP